MKYTGYSIINDKLYSNSKYVTVDSKTNFSQYKNCDMVCFNDTACVDDFEACRGNLIEFLENQFPDKSSFEKDDNILKVCFGIISWLPDNKQDREKRIDRLNSLFTQLHDIFGDVEYLIVAQNWKDYQIPSSVKGTIYNYNKLGIINARKMLGKHFLESSYDYLIMCDDDVVLEVDNDFTKEEFFDTLKKHPNGFMFLQYSWSLNMCAVSRSIYSQSPMVDIDPEKGEGYEDVVWPNLLHYKHKNKEFNVRHIKFVQNKGNYVKELPSTWDKNVNHDLLNKLSNFYVNRFKKGIYTIDKKLAKEYLGVLKYVENARWYGWLREDEIQKLLDKYK